MFKDRMTLIVVLMLLLAGNAFGEVEINYGEDFSSPLRRFDFRGVYQENTSDRSQSHTTLRLDYPFLLGNDWILATRFDQSFTYREFQSSSDKFGVGDLLAQVLVIAPQNDRIWTLGGGLRAYIPTIADDEFGVGRYTVAPMAVLKFDTPFISQGGFMGLVVANHFDSGGKDEIADLQFMTIQPVIFANLSEWWYIASKPEMRVNWELDGRWFIPFDLQVGLLLRNSMVISLEYRTPIVDDLPLYQNEFETRIGFFF